MPDKVRQSSRTGEVPRIHEDDIRRRHETMQPLVLPEAKDDAGASTGIMPIIHEPGDEEALREANSPDEDENLQNQ